MKKKSSDEQWYGMAIFLGLSCLLCVVMFTIKPIASSWAFTRVSSQIPIVYEGLNEEEKISKASQITAKTPVIVLTDTSFFFGKITAFTENILHSNDKYRVDHEEGQPQIQQLLADVEKWLSMTKSELDTDILVLSPSANIPLPIVIQTLYWLKRSNHFRRVVLAGGIT